MSYPEQLWKTIYASNEIEEFNSKLKCCTKKKIIMNSEENTMFVITSCCVDYTKNAGKIVLRHFSEMSDEQKISC